MSTISHELCEIEVKYLSRQNVIVIIFNHVRLSIRERFAYALKSGCSICEPLRANLRASARVDNLVVGPEQLGDVVG